MAIGIQPTRAMFTGDGGSNCLTLQIAGPDLVRGVGYDLVGMQNALLDQAPDDVMVTPSSLAASDIVSHSPFFSAER